MADPLKPAQESRPKRVHLSAETLDLLRRLLVHLDEDATANVIRMAQHPALLDHAIRFAAAVATARAELGFLP
jgi:hypothetical protein